MPCLVAKAHAWVACLALTAANAASVVDGAFASPPGPKLLSLRLVDVDSGRAIRRLRRRGRARQTLSGLGVLRDPTSEGRSGAAGGGSAGRRRSRQDDDSPPSPRSRAAPEASSELSTFWRAVAHVERPTEDDVVPCAPYLDADGPLPFGAYRGCGREEFDVPRVCLVTVALDLSSGNGGRALDPASRRPMGQLGRVDGTGMADAEEAVRNVRSLIDAGFTTFQIAQPEEESTDPDATGAQEWAEQNVYGRLRAEVPLSVLRGCHMMTRVGVPPAAEAAVKNEDAARPFGRGTAVREAIGASLRRMGGECIDSVQVPYEKDSPYHLDVLNVLFEMQREGIIRSIGGLNFPPSLVQSAEECGFHLDTNQVQCNILDPHPYDEALPLCSSVGMKLLIGSPLAGGLLTDRFLHMPDEPHPLYLSSMERRHVRTTLRTWAERRSDGRGGDDGSNTESGGGIWQRFHRDVLGALGDVSHKHQEPVSAVALRWALRRDSLGSVVVSSRVGAAAEREEGGGRPYDRHRSLRRLFAFDLDEEDEERLRGVSGQKRPSALEEDMKQFLDGDMLLSGDLFVPDLSNRKLWL